MIKMIGLLLVSHLSRSWRFVPYPNRNLHNLHILQPMKMGNEHKNPLIIKNPRNIYQTLQY